MDRFGTRFAVFFASRLIFASIEPTIRNLRRMHTAPWAAAVFGMIVRRPRLDPEVSDADS